MSKQINDLNKALHQDCAKESTVTTKVNEVKTEIVNNYITPIIGEMGTLGNLQTSEKSSLVGATNEILDMLYSLAAKFSNVKQIACGLYHTFILKNDGSVWSCGWNRYGELGLGDNTKRTAFTQVTTNINNDVKQIACCDDYTFILKNDGSLWACGYNTDGQLGLGLSTDPHRNTFTQVTTNISNDVKQIACGPNHAVILKNDGSVYSCGKNNYGQLGLNQGNTYTTSAFIKVTTNINNDVKQIACGDDYTFIIKNDGSVWSCGANDCGQLGIGTLDTNPHNTFTKVTTNINNDVKQVACGRDHTFIIKNDGSLWSCGYNHVGQLGLNDKGQRSSFNQATTNVNNDVKQVVCGISYTFILKNDGSIWSCGYNNKGQLGLNDTTSRNTFTKVTTNINNDVKEIDCGPNHTFIIKNDGSIWCCGNGDNGQLGLGDGTNSYYSTIVKINPFTIF